MSEEGKRKGHHPHHPAEHAPSKEKEPAGEEPSGASEAEIAELKDRLLRQAADFENYRKRVAREREEIICHANERLIGDLLPVLDNLERALANEASCSDLSAFVKGVRLIEAQLRDVLVRCGLEELASQGMPFDPSRHEAVGVVPPGPGTAEEGAVQAEVRRGYLLKGKVLRPAQVLVALSPGSKEGEAEDDAEEQGRG